jgi:hypothetical protein
MTVKGSDFSNLINALGTNRLTPPVWDDDNYVTPSLVRRLIEWCFEMSSQIFSTGKSL